MGHTHRYQFGFFKKKKKKSGKESQYMVSHSELDLDPPIGSDRESGCDMAFLSCYALQTKLLGFVATWPF